MKKQNTNLLIGLLVVIAAFIIGNLWGQNRALKKEKVAGLKTEEGSEIEFAPEKSEKPGLKFFVMSYCPFGNQAEAGLKPVFELLGDKVDWQPQYIVSKSTEEQIRQNCQPQIYTQERCQDYVDQGYFPDLESCKERLFASEEECFKAGSEGCLAAEGGYYCSLHGKKELNQDIREICAWNSTEEKGRWWQFIDLINNNCQLEEVDQCWQEQAEKAGLDKDKIQDCFNNQAIEILDQEIAATEKYLVSGSPTIFINETSFPPEGAYSQGGEITLTVGKSAFSQEEYRSPEALKQALCAAFEKAPKECQTELSKESSLGGGSCN